MRKRIGLAVLILSILSVIVLNFGQPLKYMAEDDEVIEWQSYDVKETV